jgi:hypothetical protein
VIKTFEDQVGQFLLGCMCPVNRALSCKNKNPLVKFVKFPLRFSFKMSFICASTDELHSGLIVWPFGSSSMRRMPYCSQKIETRNFQRIFALGSFWGGVSRYAATPLIVPLSPGHSDINKCSV